MLLRGRIDRHAFARLVDARERLQRDAAAVILQGAAQILPVAAHGERRSADRAAEVEGENLAALIAPELQRHQCEEHRLAGARRADDEAVADVADMKSEAERSRAFGLAVEQGGITEMLVPFRSEEHTSELQSLMRSS